MKWSGSNWEMENRKKLDIFFLFHLYALLCNQIEVRTTTAKWKRWREKEAGGRFRLMMKFSLSRYLCPLAPRDTWDSFIITRRVDMASCFTSFSSDASSIRSSCKALGIWQHAPTLYKNCKWVDFDSRTALSLTMPRYMWTHDAFAVLALPWEPNTSILWRNRNRRWRYRKEKKKLFLVGTEWKKRTERK